MTDRLDSHTRSLPTAGIALAGVLALGILQLLLSFFPSVATWGMDYWSELGLPTRLALVGVLLLSAIPAVGKAINSLGERILGSRIAGGVIILLLVSLFIGFRSHGYAYGDGYSLISHLGSSELPQLHDQLYLQPLDIIVHWLMARFVIDPLGLPLETSYAVLGAIGGIVSLGAIWRIAQRLSADRSGVLFIAAAACTSAVVVFWFGHVESYSLVNCALLWCLAFALDVRSNRRAIWWAWGVCLVGIAFHTLMTMAAPILIWLHWTRAHRPDVQRRGARGILYFALGFVISGLGAWAFNALGRHIFVPITPTADSAYAAFSLSHLADVLNLVLFLAPLTLLALLVAGRSESSTERSPHRAHVIVAAFAAVAFYFAFWVDPLLGAFRDWDLLAAFGIPMSIWAASVIIRRYELKTMRTWLWVPVAAFAIAHVGSFVGTVQDETAVAMRIDRLVRQDVHYSAEFYDGTRLAPWARILDRVFQRYDLEREHLSRWTEIDPSNGTAWASLANSYLRLRAGDSALACFERAWSLEPDNDAFGYCAGLMRLKKGDSLAAMRALERVVVLSDTSYTARTVLGSLYLRFGQYDRADSILLDAKRLNARFPDAYLYLAKIRERRGHLLDALAILDEALGQGIDSPELRSDYQRIQQRISENPGNSEQ